MKSPKMIPRQENILVAKVRFVCDFRSMFIKTVAFFIAMLVGAASMLQQTIT